MSISTTSGLSSRIKPNPADASLASPTTAIQNAAQAVAEERVIVNYYALDGHYEYLQD